MNKVSFAILVDPILSVLFEGEQFKNFCLISHLDKVPAHLTGRGTMSSAISRERCIIWTNFL